MISVHLARQHASVASNRREDYIASTALRLGPEVTVVSHRMARWRYRSTTQSAFGQPFDESSLGQGIEDDEWEAYQDEMREDEVPGRLIQRSHGG